MQHDANIQFPPDAMLQALGKQAWLRKTGTDATTTYVESLVNLEHRIAQLKACPPDAPAHAVYDHLQGIVSAAVIMRDSWKRSNAVAQELRSLTGDAS